MRLILIFILCFSVGGCVWGVREEEKNSSAATLTPEADKQTVRIDPRLLEDCPDIKDVLQSGDEDAFVSWAKTVLGKSHACRVKQKELADWVKKTFNIELN